MFTPSILIMISWVYVYVQTHQITYTKYVHFFVYEFYFNKVISKKNVLTEIQKILLFLKYWFYFEIISDLLKRIVQRTPVYLSPTEPLKFRFSHVLYNKNIPSGIIHVSNCHIFLIGFVQELFLTLSLTSWPLYFHDC